MGPNPSQVSIRLNRKRFFLFLSFFFVLLCSFPACLILICTTGNSFDFLRLVFLPSGNSGLLIVHKVYRLSKNVGLDCCPAGCWQHVWILLYTTLSGIHLDIPFLKTIFGKCGDLTFTLCTYVFFSLSSLYFVVRDAGRACLLQDTPVTQTDGRGLSVKSVFSFWISLLCSCAFLV